MIGSGIIVFDMLVYIILGVLLMRYDDFYDSSNGPYWSLESMKTSDKIVYIGINVWNVINLVAIVFAIYKIIKAIRRSRTLV